MSDTALPIQEIAFQIKQSVIKNPITLVYAPPGAGKSTWLPYYLLKELPADFNIVMLEPRRLAAKGVALRLANHLNEEVGETIGYKVRFENKTSVQTRLEVVTEGVFLNQLITESDLPKTNLVIFDEFHERNLQSDLSLALVLELQQILRPDLRILLMSATLDIEQLQTFFPDAELLESKGRSFPIHYYYEKNEEPIFNLSFVAKRVKEIVQQTSGDILVFLPGVFEITTLQNELNNTLTNVWLLSLYADLSLENQQKAITKNKDSKRKVILSTSIAETSLTIEGIEVVIDCGWMRVPVFNPDSGLTKLNTVRVTQDAAIQRGGRAGRLSEGKCFRLYTQATYNFLTPARKPEILSADLSPLILSLAKWGSINLKDYSFITQPPESNIKNAIQLLNNLKLLDNNKLTETGKTLVNYPTHPRLSNMLHYAKSKNTISVLSTAIALVALLEEKDPFKNASTVDVWERLKEFNLYLKKQKCVGDFSVYARMEKTIKWWISFFKIDIHSFSIELSEELMGELLARAYPDRIAGRVEKNIYKLSNGIRIQINDSDAISTSNWLVIPALHQAHGLAKPFLACLLNINNCADFFTTTTQINWNEKNLRPEKFTNTNIGQLLIEQKTELITNEQDIAAGFIEKIKATGLSILNFNDEVIALQARVFWLIQTNQLPWKNIDNQSLLNNLEQWLMPYLSGIKNLTQLCSIDFEDAILNWLGYNEREQLNKLAPKYIEVPTGSNLKINYQLRPDQPILEVRLQEIFGWIETPTINQGKTLLLIQLLSPGYKPVQLTNDLKSFWNNAYFEIKKELKQRYPKHSWPDNPLEAKPIRGAEKKKKP
ncbi:MAG: ATP-dependent helicase HrpB [Bacteroidia bacterium]|nr:ATP-dependent helicase HrpB [Bacteroidia bacterium]